MAQSRPPERAGLLDSLFDLLREAFVDIRHKVLEEGWFGRQVTGDSPAEPPSLGWDVPQRSFDELWGPVERSGEKDTAAHDHDTPGMDL